MMESEGRKITKIARECEKLVIAKVRKEGIGTGEIDLIHYVRHHPGVRAIDAAKDLNMDKAAVTRRVLSLQKKGYLKRERSNEDARSILLYATEAASSLKLDKVDIESDFYEWLLSDLSEDDREHFLTTLNTIYWKSKKESRSGFPHFKESDHA